MVTLKLERAADGPVAGVDEAGRGPLAGPVVAAALVVPGKHVPRALRGLIDDSKRLSGPRRAAAYDALREAARRGEIAVAVGAASAREIDASDILRATFLAMSRALARLKLRPALALIDGDRIPPGLPCPARPVIGGDARVFSIAAASIVAKQIRDRAMCNLALRYPGFGWERNMGYGTAAHLQAIASLGPTNHHRLSFAPLSQASFDF
jgi:ribonuclease HII